MKTHKQITLVLAFLGGLFLVVVVLAAPAVTTVERYVYGSGGGYAVVGSFALGGTIGQASVGTDSAEQFDLCSGFWCGLDAESLPPAYNLYLPLGIRQAP
jgi:hypothetical protein